MDWPPLLYSARTTLLFYLCIFHSLTHYIDAYSKLDKHANNNTEVPYLLTDVEMRCPEGWENEGAKCFKLYQSERSWPQALIFCSRYGATLARIESQKENLFVSQMLTRPQRASTWSHSAQWIGLISQQGSNDEPLFMWADGTSVSRYIGFWAPEQPDYSTGSCTQASLDRRSELEWSLSMCNLLLPFVCELPACVSGSFFCHNGKCVQESSHCNGVNDCGDFSDELNCPMAHSAENCMHYIRGENGKIETPNYPSSYRSNSNCRWVIEGPVNSRITLSFDVFETEENQDLVTILDGGPAENSTLVLETLSGAPKSSQLTLTSSTNMLTVRFRSDSAIQARGFQASWRANSFTCGGMLKAQAYSQSFSSPRPYPAGGECSWRIEASQGQLISLNIDTFEIDDNKDFLIIYDGSQPSAPVLAKLTGKIENQLIISTQSHLYLYFYSNYANSAKGFTISYKKGCDNTISYTHGALLSPGNGILPYPPSQKCKYTIELPESKQGQPIALAVNKFDVLADDYLKIYEDDKQEKPLHEGQGFNELQRPAKHLHAKQSKVVLVFETNALKNAYGWNLTFSTNCPVLTLPKSVYLSTQNTAFGTKVGVTCKTGHEFSNGLGQRFDMTCELGGKWSNSHGTLTQSVDTISHCQPIYCGAVPQIANGIAENATNVTYGGRVKYRCYNGFSFTGGKLIEEIVCKEDGWTQAPKCKAESCPALPQFLSGKRVLRFGDGTSYGTVYEFNCETGYRQVGSPTILCRSDGRWSSEQPACRKLICPNIPRIKNGKIVVSGGRLEFGDSARVECASGYRSTGAEIVQCLANQTLSQVPECRDLDECVEELASCSGKSTECVNLDGGYTCKCLNGFRPQLNCPSFLPLIPVKVETSSSQIANLSNLAYCADTTDSQRAIVFTFATPKILERIRFEKINNGMPQLVSIEYANNENGQFLSNANLSHIEMGNVEAAGSQIVVLHDPVETQMIRITIHEFKHSPCTRIELMGCQKSSCVDTNECDEKNGYCDHLCHNSQGSYKCSCNEGYDLFKSDGQNGVFLKDGETGYSNLDTVRFNKTCVARRCAQITAPENGKIVSSANDFRFPSVVEFQCKFGYQIHGSRYLKCMADGQWNSSIPSCTPAVCEGIQNNTSIGMFVSPSSPFVAYGDNVTIACTQQNRPARVSPLGGIRQCIYDPHTNEPEYWMSGPAADCPLVDCGPPPSLAGAFYEGDENSFKVGSSFGFSCRPPYSLIGKSSYDDRIVRCNVDGTWDLGDLRCEGPMCVDPGHPDEGRTFLDSVEEGAIAKFKCNRPGYKPFPSDSINCTLGAHCLLSEDVGISTGFIPDGAFSDSNVKTVWEIKSLGAAEMRNVFLEFFKQDKNHTCWHSSSSIPHANPTLLFANAGMHQFKSIFQDMVNSDTDLGKLTRAVNTQSASTMRTTMLNWNWLAERIKI